MNRYEPFSDQSLSDFCQDLEFVTCDRSVLTLSARFLQAAGCSMISYVHLPPPGAADRVQPIGVAAIGYPKDFAKKYILGHLAEHDPMAKAVLELGRPFWWKERLAGDHLSPDEAEVVNLALSHGVKGGLAIPVFGPHARNGYVGLGFANVRTRPTIAQLARHRIAAQAAHQRYCQVLRQDMSPPRLSTREREILQLIAAAKSNAVIADILSLSINTVDSYVRRIFGKLQVNDRLNCVLRAMALGLIT
ncbi:MAG: autoinducer binding domain-containing protein [Pseudomonadota bacterium]